MVRSDVRGVRECVCVVVRGGNACVAVRERGRAPWSCPASDCVARDSPWFLEVVEKALAQ